MAILVARMLWAFDIEYALEKGQIDTFAFTQGFNSGPQPFKASFKLRDDGRRKAIEKAWQEAEKDVGILLDRAAPTRG